MANGVYTNHRENQREWILNVAEDLFIQKGIEKVTLSDITQATRLTRPTLYNYFSSKEQMAQEIFKIVTRGWVERDEREVWSIPGSGYEKIERFINSHFTYLFQNLRESRFIAEFNYLYAKEWSVEQGMKLFAETLESERQNLFASVRAGQADGSLRGDIQAELMLAVILNFNSGMMSRLGELGDKVEGEYGMNVQTIFEQVSRVFLDGLKAR